MLAWRSLKAAVVPEHAVCADGRVQYKAFLSPRNLRCSFARVGGGGGDGDYPGGGGGGDLMFDALYANRPLLEAIFAFFDEDGSGAITHAEFEDGVAKLNRSLPEARQIAPATLKRFVDIMDVDRSGEVDLNEFLEVPRIVDAADGSVDGSSTSPGSLSGSAAAHTGAPAAAAAAAPAAAPSRRRPAAAAAAARAPPPPAPPPPPAAPAAATRSRRSARRRTRRASTRSGASSASRTPTSGRTLACPRPSSPRCPTRKQKAEKRRLGLF